MTEPVYITLNHAAEMFGQCRRTISNLIAAKQITAVKAGRSTLIVYQSIKDYYDSRPKAEYKMDARAKRQFALTTTAAA
jgi:excisionase family DNA binding protein